MASGFFLGGAAQGLQAGAATVADIRYQQLEQQRLAQQQQNIDRNFYMKLADQFMEGAKDHLQIEMDADAAAHPETPIETIRAETRKRFLANSGYGKGLGMVQTMYQKLGIDPAIPQAMFTDSIGSIAPRAAIEGSIARAKESPYKLETERLGIEEKRANLEVLDRQKQLETLSDTAAGGATPGPNPDSPGPSTQGQLGGQTSPSTGRPVATVQAQTSQAQPTLNDRFTPATQPQDAGTQFLSRIPATARTGVQGLADYTINPNTYSSRIPKGMDKSPRQIMTELATQYAAARGETYDQTEFSGRQKLYNSFMGGQEGKQTRSYNVLVDHLDVLNESIDALEHGVGTGDYQRFNQLAVDIARATGNPAPGSFDAVKEIVGDELVKAITGGAAALGDREAIKKDVDAATRPDTLRAIVDKYMKLAAGQLRGLQKEYETGGRKDYQQRFLTDRTRKAFITIPLNPKNVQEGTSGGVKWKLEQ